MHICNDQNSINKSLAIPVTFEPNKYYIYNLMMLHTNIYGHEKMFVKHFQANRGI